MATVHFQANCCQANYANMGKYITGPLYHINCHTHTHSLIHIHSTRDKALFTHLVEATSPAPNRTGSLDMRNLYSVVLIDPQNGTWGSITI